MGVPSVGLATQMAQFEPATGPVPTAGLGGVNQREGWGNVIGRCPLLVQVNGHAWHIGRPARVDEQRGVIKWPRRGVDYFAVDSAVLGRSSGGSRREGLLAEFDETVLAGETLPTLCGNPGRIDTTSRTARSTSAEAGYTGLGRAICVGTVVCTRYPQGS